MFIDKGAPSECGVTGVITRINKLRNIQEIPFGKNLDLGTGAGAYYPELKKYSKMLLAFDREMTYLKEFTVNNPNDSEKIFLASSEKIPIKSESFEAVFSIEVLEHVNNLELTIREVNRVLKKNGYFFLTVPNKYFPLETHMVHFGNVFVKGKYTPFLSMFDFIHKKIGTARRFSDKDFYEYFTKFGFEVIGIDYMMPPFDYFKFGQKYIKNISDRMEKGFMKKLSMTLIVVLKKQN